MELEPRVLFSASPISVGLESLEFGDSLDGSTFEGTAGDVTPTIVVVESEWAGNAPQLSLETLQRLGEQIADLETSSSEFTALVAEEGQTEASGFEKARTTFDDPVSNLSVADPGYLSVSTDEGSSEDSLSGDMNTNERVIAPSPKQIVFIDGKVDQWEDLAEGLYRNEDASIEVVVLDATRDGIGQITEYLGNREDISAIHLVSHGNAEQLMIGQTTLTHENLDDYANQFLKWRESLVDGADLLIYGCDLAESENGQTLLSKLSMLCDCDVAGSIDSTGHESLGGNWKLEWQIGSITNDVVFNSVSAESWIDTLQVFSVSSTAGDNSVGTIAWAVEQANLDALVDRIEFNLTGTGIHRIMLDNPLVLSTSMVLDATTQQGFSVGAPVIELDGQGINGGSNPLIGISASDVEVRGFSIINGPNAGIEIAQDNAVIAGNWIGVNASGGIEGNTIGILSTSGFSLIGGTTIADRNVISGNVQQGIVVQGSAQGNVIIGNRIGTDISGTNAIGNQREGILIRGTSESNQVGGLQPGEGNLIANNGDEGVRLNGSGNGNAIRGNLIFSNGRLEIDLGSRGVLVNDMTSPVADNDSGANRLQNYPVVSFAEFDGTNLQIEGEVSGRAFINYEIDFYATALADPSGFGGGERYLGTVIVPTDGDGVVNFSESIATTIDSGEFLTATANHSDGSTSEFSRAFLIAIPNRAPVLDNSSDLEMVIPVDETSNLGLTIADWLAVAGTDPITDADGDPDGIAIIGIDDSNGRWEASLDDGASWIPLNVVSVIDANNAVLLNAASRVRFVPDSGFEGQSSALDFRAWDQTDGSVNSQIYVDTTPAGGATAFSIAVEQLVVTTGDVIDEQDDAFLVDEDSLLTNVNVLDNDQFAGTLTASLSVSSYDSTSALGANVTVQSDGTVFYDPGNRFNYLATGDTASDTFQYTVTDGNGNSDVAEVLITIEGRNDRPSLSDQLFSIDESEANGFTVGGVAALDVDQGHSGQLGFTIVGGAGQGIFEISNSGQITLINDSAIDFESANQSYTLDVRVIDNDALPLSQTATITIDINDVNEAPALFIDPLVTSVLDTDDPVAPLLVANLQVIDDALGSESLRIDGPDASSFQIIGNQLYLSAGISLDASLQSSYLVNVVLDDPSLGSNRDSEQPFVLAVSNGNGAPSVQLVNTVTDLLEDLDTSSSTKVADILIVDDGIGSHQLSLAGSDSGMFEIVGQELFLRAGVALDFETQNQLNVTVVVDDTTLGTGPEDSSGLAIDITDVSEVGPTVVITSTTELETDELGGTAEFEISLSAVPLSQVIVNLSSDNDSEGITTFTTLTFDASNWNVPQLVTVVGQPDVLVDGDTVFEVFVTTTSVDLSFNQLEGGVQVVNRDRTAIAPTQVATTISGGEEEATNESEESESESLSGVAPAPEALQTVTVTSGESRSKAIQNSGEQIGSEDEGNSRNENSFSLSIDSVSQANSKRVVRAQEQVELSTALSIQTYDTVEPLSQTFYRDMDDLRNVMEAQASLPRVVVGSVASMASALTVGYVTWLIRGGQILVGVLGQLPAWRFVDPLPILSAMAEHDEDDESLANMVDKDRESDESFGGTNNAVTGTQGFSFRASREGEPMSETVEGVTS